ncbi:MAG: cytochrome c [Rhodospirillales bacterium]
MSLQQSLKAALIVPALLALAVATSPGVQAADPLEGVVKARQGYFQLVLLNAGTLFGMAKGDVAYDADKAQTAADNLVLLSSMDTSALWAAGTSKEEMPGKTRALKAIWDTWPAVTEKVAAFKKATADMADFAGAGVEGIQANAGALGGACKGCHDDFRAKDF